MSSTLHRRFTVPLVMLAASGLVLSGCSADGGGGSGGTGPGDAGEADGVVTVYGTIIDTEEDLLNESWAAWEEENNIEIKYESSKEFETQISIRAQGGNAPDLAIFPQPDSSPTCRRATTSSPPPRVSPTTSPSTGPMTGRATPRLATCCTAPR